MHESFKLALSLCLSPVLEEDGVLEVGVVRDVGVVFEEGVLVLEDMIVREVGVVFASWVSTLVGIQGGAKVRSLLMCLSFAVVVSEA